MLGEGRMAGDTRPAGDVKDCAELGGGHWREGVTLAVGTQGGMGISGCLPNKEFGKCLFFFFFQMWYYLFEAIQWYTVK